VQALSIPVRKSSVFVTVESVSVHCGLSIASGRPPAPHEISSCPVVLTDDVEVRNAPNRIKFLVLRYEPISCRGKMSSVQSAIPCEVSEYSTTVADAHHTHRLDPGS
jgi:hypothetical protein